MQRSTQLIPVAIFGAALLMSSNVQAGSDPIGVWFNDTGRGAIEIKPCGNALCGHVVWVKDQGDAKGCGKQIIGEAEKVEGGVWDNGWIYSPEQKKRFDVELKVVEGKLRVMGYMGTKLFSKTMYWTKAPSDLARCDQVQAAVKTAPAPAKVVQTEPPAAKIAEPKIADMKVAEPKIAAIEIKNVNASPATPSIEAPPVSAPRDGASTAPQSADQPPASPAPEVERAPTAAPKTAAALPEPAASAQNETEEPAKKPKKKVRLGNLDLDKLNLGDLKLDKIVKRSASGDCRLDLPFVKVHFKCEDK